MKKLPLIVCATLTIALASCYEGRAGERKDAGTPRFMKAGVQLAFTDASASAPGIMTVMAGVLEVTYFDGTTGTVGMGKFPVLKANVVKDAWVVIDEDAHPVSYIGGKPGDDTGVLRSGTWHTHWMEWSKWQ